MRTTLSVILCTGAAWALLALAALATPVHAQEISWAIRFNGIWNDPDLRVDQMTDDQRLQVDTDSGFGYGVFAEYRASSRLGVEFGVLTASDDVVVRVEEPAADLTASAFDAVDFTVWSTSLNIHLTPNDKVDFYLGPILAIVMHEDLTLTVGDDGAGIEPGETAHIRIDDDWGVGAVIGLDVPIGQGGWAFNANAKYLDTDVEAIDEDGDREAFSFDPLIIGVGVAYRF